MNLPPELTLGPVLFNWPSGRLTDFYARIADEAPIDRVYLGEIVCGKRSPLLEASQLRAAERLARGGKKIVWSTLISPVNKRERRAMQAISELEDEIEINDFGVLASRDRRKFTAGPLLNVYNEAALGALQREGCVRWCPPVELSLDAIRSVHGAIPDMPIELFAFGRLPLAHSGRCYHARFHSLNKDSCQYVCEEDPDGKRVDTIEGAPFLAFNGVQTLSDGVQIAALAPDVMRVAGITALRLSPHSSDMVKVARAFRSLLDGQTSVAALEAQLAGEVLGRPVVNGYLQGKAGMERLPA